MNESNDNARLDLPSWRFKVAKLGCLSTGDIEFKPLTLVCGPNNTGKTWVMYALYGFLKSPSVIDLPDIARIGEEVTSEGQISWDFEAWMESASSKIISSIHKSAKRRLPDIFNSPQALFAHSKFDWEIEHQNLKNFAIKRGINFSLVLGRERNEALRFVKKPHEPLAKITLQATNLPDISFILSDAIARHLLGLPAPGERCAFLIPAERNGLHLFHRELSRRRTALLHHATKKDKDINLGELIRDVMASHYAEPIAHYIDWLNDLPELRRNKRGLFHSVAEDVKKLVGGRYDVDTEGQISFTPYKLKKGDGETPPKLDLHLASSTVKSLFGLWFYLEYEAQPGDVLMIDEPELNLHPSNQRFLARLLARLVNCGLRVIISTHSDYIVREFNSLIMLSKPHAKRSELMERFGYQEPEALEPDKVAAYLFENRGITLMDITQEEGIHADTFDSVIHELNETSDEIYYTYQDLGEDDAWKG